MANARKPKTPARSTKSVRRIQAPCAARNDSNSKDIDTVPDSKDDQKATETARSALSRAVTEQEGRKGLSAAESTEHPSERPAEPQRTKPNRPPRAKSAGTQTGTQSRAPKGGASERTAVGPAELVPAKFLSPQDPESSAPPPGIASPGDSRSFRRVHENREEFVLIYRDSANVIRRQGIVGKEGQWNCIQYPTLGAAAHAYAQECSVLTGQGFLDLRE